MTNAAISPAPRWRRVLAGLIDAALVRGVAWRLRRTERVRGGGWAEWMSMWLIASSGELVREHLRSPGQRLLGLQSVDDRTGRPVELWRSLAVLGVDAGGQALTHRLTPPEQGGERVRVIAELDAIYERHPDDPAAREAERRVLFDRHPRPKVWRAMVPGLAVGLVNKRLRRRLAPTTEVLVRRPRGSHSP